MMMNEQLTNDQVRAKLPPELRYQPKKRNRAMTIFQWTVIIIAGTGFVYKFIEYTLSVFASGNELVNFAITPLVMYISVAIGFFLLFLWTVLRGDYKDIERPKYRLFERELEIDLRSGNVENASVLTELPLPKN
jgi:hypothetical protein